MLGPLGGGQDSAEPVLTGCRLLDLAALRVFYDNRGLTVSPEFLEQVYEVALKDQRRATSPSMSTNPLFDAPHRPTDEFMIGLDTPRQPPLASQRNLVDQFMSGLQTPAGDYKLVSLASTPPRPSPPLVHT